MSDHIDTVELPADPDLKQLSHDVIRGGNEDAVPMILDFAEFITSLDENDHSSMHDLDVDDPQSEIAGSAWRNLLDTLEDQDVIEVHRGSGSTTYTLK